MQPTQPAPYPPDDNLPARGGPAKDLTVALLALFGLIYIFIPSVIPDFVPDLIPFVGQLDDNMALLLILNSFRYFGYDLATIIPGLRWILSSRRANDKLKRS